MELKIAPFDVALHAICDGLLGAIGEKDIGEHFPDTDPAYKAISSRQLLEKIGGIVAQRGFVISNIDAIIMAEEPALGPFKEKMRESIAGSLGLAKEQVSIKAKTNEGLGFIGEGEAIAAFAVVSLQKDSC